MVEFPKIGKGWDHLSRVDSIREHTPCIASVFGHHADTWKSPVLNVLERYVMLSVQEKRNQCTRVHIMKKVYYISCDDFKL